MDIESLNSELRQKLGAKPLYGWKRGSELYVVLPVLKDSTTPEYEVTAIEGTGLIGTVVKHEKVYYQDLYEKVRPGLQLGARWVLCRLFVNDASPEDWNRMFGGKIQWVERAWVPVDWTGGRAVGGHLMSDPYQPVTSELQQRAIQCIRMNQKFRETVNRRQMFHAAYDDREAREKRITEMGIRAKEAAPVGGWTRMPGEKSDVVLFSGKSKESVQ
jgi:hypothetical protein